MAVINHRDGTVEALSPCGDPISLTDGEPVTEVTVVLDPGHGGPVDTGAVAPTGMAEKEINLKVALAAKAILDSRGIPTQLTRIGDYPIPIPTRSAYADMMGAAVLVSIHHNAPVAPSSDTPGIEVFIQNGSAESSRLGGLVYEETMAALGQFDVDWDRAPDAGVMTVLNPEGDDAYGMVRLPETTSLLLELGYIANRAEAELYLRPEYVSRTATAIADAIQGFLTTDSAGSGHVEGRVFQPNSGVGKDRCVDVELEQPLYPNVVNVGVSETATGWDIDVAIASPYDSPERYADSWRVIGDDGVVYGVRELLHDHANEQPFTRSLPDVVIPTTVRSITIEGHDLVYGWGGDTFEVVLP